MKRILFLLAVVAVMVLLFAPVATAQYYGGGMATSTATATATPTATATTMSTATATTTATATATALPRSGGPSLAGPVSLVAGLTLMASGVGALMLVRRREL
jgi:carbohydrate-binding DOMON domain-containing protein